ncbi:MAG TPA: maleylpyruvate isomerase family mycothiol-dependent enzyme [Microthrixaceae bacterium]|nr:maleylpyruvate isomerase family mycothiol-dependent enzyme [Microthrixaceae bacterium]
MDRDAYLDSLRADRARFAALGGPMEAEDERLDLTVPTCPDWTLAELLTHLGRIHRWAMDSSKLAPDASFPRLGPRPDAHADLLGWLTDGIDELIEDLGSTDLDAACWTFAGPGTRRFWLRRQAMETAVHRYDAEITLGTPDPVAADIAADGVDEWLDLEAGRWYKGRPEISGTIHLHATDPIEEGTGADGSGEWFIQVDAARLHWNHGHEKGDVAVRASRSELFLLAWRRREASDLEVFGDAELLDAFLHQTQVS